MNKLSNISFARHLLEIKVWHLNNRTLEGEKVISAFTFFYFLLPSFTSGVAENAEETSDYFALFAVLLFFLFSILFSISLQNHLKQR